MKREIIGVLIGILIGIPAALLGVKFFYRRLFYKKEEKVKKYNEEIENLNDNIKNLNENIKNLKEEKSLFQEVTKENLKEILDKTEQARSSYLDLLRNFENEKEENEEFLLGLKDEILELKKIREKANSLILNNIKKREEENFFKITLSKEDISDIIVLKELLPKIINKRAIHQVIYDVYYKSPLKDLLVRVLEGRSVCGIYKITNLETDEAYIGKSVDLKKRWTEHVRSSLNLGTIARTKFHNVLYEKGIENFSFEVLEECSRDKLTEREKFWIDFFNSKVIGYNSLK